MKSYLRKRSNKNRVRKITIKLLMNLIISLIILVLGFTGNNLFAGTICFAENEPKLSLTSDSNENLPPSKDSNTVSTQTTALVFPDELARFSTSFSVSDQTNRNRAYNMKLVCSKVNGKVVETAKTFSFNNATGPRTDDLGYKPAWIYVNGGMVKDTGGGVCQVSSTLYNAVLLADLEIVERKNHQFAVSYVKKGMDATVFYGSQDFKFKNSSNAPMKIQCYVSKDNKLTFILKGTRVKTTKNVSYESKLVKNLPFTTTIKYDPALEDKKRVSSGHTGMNGYIVDVFKVYTDKNTRKILSRTKLYTNYYMPYNQVVLEGTKKTVKPEIFPKPSVDPKPTASPLPTPVPTMGTDVTSSPAMTPTPTPEPTPTPTPIPTHIPTENESGQLIPSSNH